MDQVLWSTISRTADLQIAGLHGLVAGSARGLVGTFIRVSCVCVCVCVCVRSHWKNLKKQRLRFQYRDLTRVYPIPLSVAFRRLNAGGCVFHLLYHRRISVPLR